MAEGLIRLPFTREARPGEPIRGEVRIPDGPPPRVAVVMAHGFKGFKDWGFFPWVAEGMAAAGYAVVTFNFSRNGIGADPERFIMAGATAVQVGTAGLTSPASYLSILEGIEHFMMDNGFEDITEVVGIARRAP